MGLFVPDMIDNKTERHMAFSVRIACIGIAFAGVAIGLTVLLTAFLTFLRG